jgi:hypothetical protein
VNDDDSSSGLANVVTGIFRVSLVLLSHPSYSDSDLISERKAALKRSAYWRITRPAALLRMKFEPMGRGPVWVAYPSHSMHYPLAIRLLVCHKFW